MPANHFEKLGKMHTCSQSGWPISCRAGPDDLPLRCRCKSCWLLWPRSAQRALVFVDAVPWLRMVAWEAAEGLEGLETTSRTTRKRTGDH